jgi:hypothetical protein
VLTGACRDPLDSVHARVAIASFDPTASYYRRPLVRRVGFQCVSDSKARQESMAGTASRVRRWLAIEQPGPWGQDAIVECRMEQRVARAIKGAADRHGVRVLLIRRPGWRDDGPTKAFLAATHPTGSWIEQFDFSDCEGLLDLDLAAAASLSAPGLGEPGPSSLHLVCTNGKHDPCCADQGRPVVRALQEAGVADVWESTHVGGDRFAANVVCLPSGVYFGRVRPEQAAAVVNDHGMGMLHLENYRGRSCHPPWVQAAEIAARLHLGERRLDALFVSDVSHRGERYEVVLHRGEAERIQVVLHVARSEPFQSTCTAERQTTSRRYIPVYVAVETH